MKKCMFMTFTAFALAILPGGCSVPRRDTIVKQTFLLKVDHPDEPVADPMPACFYIRMTRVAPAFSGSQLVYRTGPVSYEQDYYNTYLSSPDEQLDEIIKRWFRDSRQFICDAPAEEAKAETLTLESHVDELYADFQSATASAGVVQMHFYLSRYDEGCGCPVEILKKTYRVSTSLPPKPNPNEVVHSLSRSVAAILSQLEKDIASQL
ncbi:MAG: hypothetical protein LLF76_00455 [Planctomycetaceae bacterium]|nr:hypothetical protein [Planctomycetaceae bacterium]